MAQLHEIICSFFIVMGKGDVEQNAQNQESVKEDLFEVADLYEPLTTKKYIRKTIKQLNAIKKIILTLDEDK